MGVPRYHQRAPVAVVYLRIMSFGAAAPGSALRVSLAWLLSLASCAVACSKSLVTEEDAQALDLPPLATEPSPSASSPQASAQSTPPMSAPQREAGAERAPAVDAGAAGADTGARKATADGGDVAACGDPPLRDCPLKAWMKANCAAAVTAGDLDALGYAFDRIATFAPPESAGFANWVSIARDGADAARAASMVGVKGACRGCHQQYKDRYRATLRARPLS
jgi:hypothetical protein